MAYDPDEHGRLDSLYLKYGAWLQSQVRADRQFGAPSFSGHDVSECYDDALTTAHAVYAYLLANPPDSSPVSRAVQWAGLGLLEDPVDPLDQNGSKSASPKVSGSAAPI